MKKTWIIAGGVVVVVLVVGVSAPWAVGKLTEQHWQEAIENFNSSQPLITMETDDYQRGFFASDITGQVTFEDPDTGESHTIPWQGDVCHGIIGSTVDFRFDDPENEVFARLFPEKKPIVTVTTRAWGTSLAEVTIPAISYLDEDTGESLNVSESYGTLTVADEGNRFEATMNWPGLVLRGPQFRLSMENFSLDQDMERLSGDVWTGDAEISVAKVSFAAKDEPDVVLEGLELVSRTTPEEDSQTFSSVTELTLDSVIQDEASFGPHRMEFKVENVNVAAWNQVADAFAELQMAGLDQGDQQAAFQRQMAAMMAVSDAAKAVAAEGFSVGLTDLDIQTPEGAVTGRAMLSHPRLSGDEQSQMTILMERLTGEMRFRMPAALLERYPMLASEFMPMISRGLLVQEGDQYQMEASLEDMQVNVNGQVVPLPPML